MQAYGSDRLREDGERWILLARRHKGWVARVGKTLTSAEFPGTAILWDERYFEVVSIEAHPAGGVRYVLEPWREQNAMRVTDRYDEDSEVAREESYRRSVLREKQRKTATLLAMLAGHLPAIVQNEMSMDLGVLAPRMTVLSIIGVYIAIAAMVLAAVSAMLAQSGVPAVLFVVAIPLSIENSIRWLIVWTQNRPIGSVIGWIGYAVYHAMTGRGPSPFAVEKGWKVPITEAPPAVAEQDAFIMREALVTLLTPAEQARVAQRYAYDYRRHSTNLALIILGGSIVGIASSIHQRAIIAGISAAALAAEQIVRLIAFRRGPAASVLRFLARPFVKKLLAVR